MKVLAYARYSGSTQRKGTSVERQVEMIEDYAARNGLALTEAPFIDRGRSAFHAAHVRGKMGVLLKRAASGDLGEGDIILVEVIDRLSREKVMKAWDQLRVFTNAGVTIITVADGSVLNEVTFEEQWTRMIDPLARMAGAHDQSKIKQDRGNDVWERRRASGVKMTTALPAWLNHNVMIHFKDQTTYVLRYRLKADLPKQKRVGARPISDFEWYAGRVGGQEMVDAWAADYAAMEADFEALEAV